MLKSVNDAVDANAANMLKEGRGKTLRYDIVVMRLSGATR
jgi:hypothetical protein